MPLGRQGSTSQLCWGGRLEAGNRRGHPSCQQDRAGRHAWVGMRQVLRHGVRQRGLQQPLHRPTEPETGESSQSWPNSSATMRCNYAATMRGRGIPVAYGHGVQPPSLKLQVVNEPAYGALVPACSAATDRAVTHPSVLNGSTPPSRSAISAEILHVPLRPLQHIMSILAQYELAAGHRFLHLRQLQHDASQLRSLYLHLLLQMQARLQEQKRCKVCASAPASKTLQIAKGVTWDITAYYICTCCAIKAVRHLTKSQPPQQQTGARELKALFGVFVSSTGAMLQACLYPRPPCQLGLLPHQNLQPQYVSSMPQESMLRYPCLPMQSPLPQGHVYWHSAGAATPCGSLRWSPGKAPPAPKAEVGCAPESQHGRGALQSQHHSCTHDRLFT